MRVRIALAKKGLTDDVEFVSVNVPEGENLGEEFRAKNPSATVPMLELDDGTCIAERTAITEYIDNLDGSPTLTGQKPKDCAMIHMMQRRAEAGSLDAVATYFHHATPGTGPDIEGYQCAEWREHQKSTALKGTHYLDGILADQPYLAGQDFSMADIAAHAGVLFAGFAKIDTSDE